MANGWARDGAVQEQIDDTVSDAVKLGFGCPELGSFSLSELESVRLPFGLRIERDLGFTTRMALSGWAAWARRAQSIIAAEQLFRSNFRLVSDQLPTPPDDKGRGEG